MVIITSYIKGGIKNTARIMLMGAYQIIQKLPRNPQIWVFGAWKGNLYADNAKYMFEYMNEFHPEIRSVWIAKNPNTINQARKKGYKAYSSMSSVGIWYCLRAGIAAFTEGPYDISGITIAGARLIQLWHGMGIKDVKKFRAAEDHSIQSRYMKMTCAYERQYWMTACQDAIEKYSDTFGVPKDRMFITGQPKDDNFVDVPRNAFVDELRKAHPGCKIVVYLPTHRSFGNKKCSTMLEYEILKGVNRMLQEKNLVMIFKPHAHEFVNYQDLDTDLSNLVFATDSRIFSDVYEFLPACDGMITDYSGIMLGYLTSGKPMIYFPYDMEDYMDEDAGFCYSYDEIAAGPVCRTWEEVVRETDRIFRDDAYVQQRRDLRMRFSPFCDGKNRERVYLEIQKLLNK